MRLKNIFFLVCIVSYITGYAQVSERQKTETWIKVWGFLKYNHPRVATGLLDWDGIFMAHLEHINEIEDEEQLNKAYIELLNSLGTVKPCEGCAKIVTQKQENNVDFDLLWQDTGLSPLVVKRLKYIRENRNIGKNYYVQFYKNIQLPLFNNERQVSYELLPDKQRRLLALARYWNAIAYFYPYKYVMDNNWEVVLKRVLPLFEAATTAYGYQNAIGIMTQALGDGSAFVASELIGEKIGQYRAPFTVIPIGEDWYIYQSELDTLTQKTGLLPGDKILAMDGEPVENIALAKSNFISKSNEQALRMALASTLLHGETASARLTVERKGEVLEYGMPRMPIQDFIPDRIVNMELPWKKINENVGYIRGEDFLMEDIDGMRRDFANSKALILDLRSFELPTGLHLADYLLIKNKVYAQMIEPNVSALGEFIERKKQHSIAKNKNYFTGEIYLLVDQRTKGGSELLTLLLKGSDRVTLIGAQTGGTLGYITKLQLPGKVEVFFTGIGVKAADRTEVQKVGIEPDVRVELTPEDVAQQTDPLLEEAVNRSSQIQ